MAGDSHYKELLQILNEHQVEYLIVGGYAVMKYSEPRYTKDLDVWVNSSPSNSEKLFRALAEFGAPLGNDGITPVTFTEASIVYQIGVAPLRVDILTTVTGIEFSQAWPNRVQGIVAGVPVHFISLDDLVANKQAVGRPPDLAQLEAIQKERQEK